MTAWKTAFVFAGGGSLGAIQVGMLGELVAAGVRPALLVGSSVGALNAAFFAGNPDAVGVVRLKTLWRSLRRRDVFPVTIRDAFKWVRGADSLFQPTSLRRLIDSNLPFKNLEDAKLPLHVVATNLGGMTTCLSAGPAVEAVLASAAIPVAFPSVQIGADSLMDGAIGGNTPILTAAELGATRIIVLPTGFACSLEQPPNGAAARGLHALTLLVANQMVRDLRQIAGTAQVHTVPSLCPLNVSPFDFSRTDELIERATLSTRAWLQSGGLSNQAIPDALRAHRH